MKVVLDTNIVISFLLTRGNTISAIFKALEEREFSLLTSDEILLEIKLVIQRFINKHRIDKEYAEALFMTIKTDGNLINTTSSINLSKDKKDNKLLACAKDGEADYLVTGDKKHLLPIKKIGRTKIISPKEFVKLTKLRDH